MAGLWTYLRVRKRFWLMPALLLAGMVLLLIAIGGDPGDEFVYTMF